MAVPVYSVIADSEIDPESPATSSLFFRLRDNILSLLGIDPATVSPVVDGFPSAELSFLTLGVWGTYLEIMDLPSPNVGDRVAILTGGDGFNGVVCMSNDGTGTYGIRVADITVVLTATIPTHVRIISRTFNAGSLATLTAAVSDIYDLPIDNADHVLKEWADLSVVGGITAVFARAYADSGGVWLRFTDQLMTSTKAFDAVHKALRR